MSLPYRDLRGGAGRPGILRHSRAAAFSFQRLLFLVRKEFIQLRRNPLTLRMIIVVPLLQTILFGYVTTTDIKGLTLLVCDLDRSALSRELSAKLAAGGFFTPAGTVAELGAIDSYLDQGRARAAVVFPVGLSARITAGKISTVQVIVDGSNPSQASVAVSHIQRMLGSEALGLSVELAGRMGLAPGPRPALDLRTRVWFNPELKSVNYMIPGVMCMVLFMITSLLTALGIVREKEQGTMEQIMVTPLRPAELIAGKTLPFALVAFVEAALVLAAGTLWFGVVLRGSLLWLSLASAVFVLTVLGIGMFVSTLAHTQAQAMMVNQLFMATNMMLSGFMFPISSMPQAMQHVTYLVPLRYFLEIVRGVYLKGTGPSAWWPQLLMLALFGLLLFSLSALRFRKRLD
ncbi:MAG TPA: ABC transporter permease [candidate division Zixibacteria bacterium]|jgi:ABC-2 type transport system permease protein|nr:ABC transporter permease [candidate division Zixibacteria bacterium]